jgi:hypothetical protein
MNTRELRQLANEHASKDEKHSLLIWELATQLIHANRQLEDNQLQFAAIRRMAQETALLASGQRAETRRNMRESKMYGG